MTFEANARLRVRCVSNALKNVAVLVRVNPYRNVEGRIVGYAPRLAVANGMNTVVPSNPRFNKIVARSTTPTKRKSA